jgi:hypothetical protein
VRQPAVQLSSLRRLNAEKRQAGSYRMSSSFRKDSCLWHTLSSERIRCTLRRFAVSRQFDCMLILLTFANNGPGSMRLRKGHGEGEHGLWLGQTACYRLFRSCKIS